MFSQPLFVTILLIVVSGFTTISAYQSRCHDGQFTNHQTSCVKYFACENRRYVERTCNFGIWNQKSSRCDFSTAICRVKTDDSWHSSGVPDCTNPKNKYHQFAHPFDCSKYYKCIKNTLVESECPKGQFWNQFNWSCDHDQRSTCEAADPRTNSNRITPEDDIPSRRYNNKGCECGKDNKVDDVIGFDDNDDDDDDYYDYSSDESIGY